VRALNSSSANFRQSMRHLVVVLVLALAALTPAASDPVFDPTPWIADLDQVRSAFLTKYANLEWAVFDREADLPQLFAETRQRIERATNDADARAAFDRLARRLGDDHVEFQWPRGNGASRAHGPVQDRCAALGYDSRMRARPLASHALGYQAITTQVQEFPIGLISSGAKRVGVIQIGVFTQQGFPTLCEAALKELAIPVNARCDDACNDRVDAWAVNRLTRDLIAQLQALKAAGATALVVDIAGNGGGSEWAEAVARMLTSIRVHSETRGFVRGEHWAQIFADDQTKLRQFARQASAKDRALLLSLADQLETRRKQALIPCDSAPLWQGHWPQCHWLGNAFYGSGLLPSANPAELRGKPWAPLVFTPMEFPYEEGVWGGPLVVLIDHDVGSAASEFAAILQDNRAAIIVGEPSGGGCGHTNGGTPTRLTNSGGTLELPDCARFRADGSNEMRGIIPDVLVGFGVHDGPRLRAARFLSSLPEALDKASRLAR
jgi:Peptidase family S41